MSSSGAGRRPRTSCRCRSARSSRASSAPAMPCASCCRITRRRRQELTACADSRFIPLLARGELDPAEEARMRAHLAGCPTCTAELAAEEQLTRRLREEVPRPAAPAELRAALEEMMRARPPPGRRKSRRLLLAAAAAVVLLTIGVSLALRKPPANDPLALARHAAAAHRAIDGQRD